LSNLLVLVERFVASFEKLDEMSADEVLDPIAWQLGTGDRNQYDRKRWRPIRVNTPLDALGVIYAKLPVRFPPLYEQLVLSHRWAEVDLQAYRLLANPPGPNLSGLLEEMSRDSIIWNSLRPPGTFNSARDLTSITIPSASTSTLERKTENVGLSRLTTSRFCVTTELKLLGNWLPPSGSWY
jgi:hypothetical protein